MAVNYILDFPLNIFQILLCVDSKSVLYALQSKGRKKTSSIILEIKYVIHLLTLRGLHVTFCWVPSHVGFLYNEWADRAAKVGAKHGREAIELHVPLSLQEGYHIEQASLSKVTEAYQLKKPFLNHSLINTRVTGDVYHPMTITNNITSRRVIALLFRIKLNAFFTKFSKNVTCLCGKHITNTHIIFECQIVKTFLPPFSENSLDKVFNNLS